MFDLNAITYCVRLEKFFVCNGFDLVRRRIPVNSAALAFPSGKVTDLVGNYGENVFDGRLPANEHYWPLIFQVTQMLLLFRSLTTGYRGVNEIIVQPKRSKHFSANQTDFP